MFLAKHIKPLYFTLFFFLFGHLGFTNTRDRNAVLHVFADSAVLNQHTHTNIFQGHVKLDQGTTHLNGDTLLLFTNPRNEILESIAFGKLARFQTQPNNRSETFNAQAENIHYFPPKNHVILKGQAKAFLHQDSYAGPYIEYNTLTQVIVSPHTEKGRTNIIIHPQEHPKS